MSAIAGLLNTQGNPIDPMAMQRIGHALTAHGTDGGGEWSQGPIGLLQRQICFTPEDYWECQPLFSGDRQIALVSASRLDNRLELMHELGLKSQSRDPLPDSVFILHAYLKWGVDCPPHLLGDYTFAIWNAIDQSLTLAVSPFSGRPLYYHRAKDFFAFATMPKGLFALKTVPRELDEHYVAKYLARVPREPEATFYRGLCRVLPGHVITITHNHFSSRNFWIWNSDQELHFSSDTECEEAFLALYERVVSDHLRSATPVGIMLSGGLDSSSIAALAVPLLKAKNQRLAAFTEVPRTGFQMPSERSRYSDETPFVEAIARLYDTIDLHFIHTDDTHFLQNSDRLYHHTETPFRNACNRPWFEAILQESQNQGIRVVLMGSQGNLTLSWKGKETLPQFVRQGQWREAVREAKAIACSTPGGKAWKNLVFQGVLPTLPSSLRSMILRLRERAAHVPAQHTASLLRSDYALEQGIDVSHKHLDRFSKDAAPEDRAFRYDTIHKTVTSGNTLMTGYQAMFGVEIRDPTADERLVRFCLALPEDQFRRNGVSRRLVRQSFAGRLPEEILSGRRRGLQSADWQEKMAYARLELQTELQRMAACSQVKRLIDLADLLQTLDQVSSAASMDISARNYLEHGLMTGSFIRWFEAAK